MAFDLSSVLNQAQEVANQSYSNSEGNPRLVYPGMGILKVKLLYNPKSNLVSRLIKRHKVGNSNYTCLGMYGQDCPICKINESIKNATGMDMWKFNPKNRGISYAQYVGSDNYTWDGEPPKVGELILLMYPWTVYQDINRLISTAGVHAEELIAKNEGKVINITHYRENSQEKYKCEIDAFADTFKTCDNDQDFENFINNLPDLNETIVPSTLNETTLKSVTEASEALAREYLRGTQNSMNGGFNSTQLNPQNNVVTVGNQQYVNVNGQLLPIMNTSVQNVPPVVPQMTPQVPPMNPPVSSTDEPPFSDSKIVPQKPTNGNGQSMPECFGKHQENDPKCLACINEIQCMTMG